MNTGKSLKLPRAFLSQVYTAGEETLMFKLLRWSPYLRTQEKTCVAKIPCWKIFVKIIASSYTVGKFLNMRLVHSLYLELTSDTQATTTV